VIGQNKDYEIGVTAKTAQKHDYVSEWSDMDWFFCELALLRSN